MQHFFSFTTKVSVRLVNVIVRANGRKIMLDSVGGITEKYRSSALKKTYAFNEKGQESKLTFLTPESSPVACSIVLIYSSLENIAPAPLKKLTHSMKKVK
jgi:hypothetical protein